MGGLEARRDAHRIGLSCISRAFCGVRAIPAISTRKTAGFGLTLAADGLALVEATSFLAGEGIGADVLLADEAVGAVEAGVTAPRAERMPMVVNRSRKLAAAMPIAAVMAKFVGHELPPTNTEPPPENGPDGRSS